jgi:hypothetical protein
MQLSFLNLDKLMKTIRILFLAALLLQFVAPVWSMPQDNWYGTSNQVQSPFGGDIAIGPDGNIYGDGGGFVAVYSTNGTLLRQFGTNMHITGIGLSSQTNVYVLDMAGTNPELLT